jgi:hypothetical protein
MHNFCMHSCLTMCVVMSALYSRVRAASACVRVLCNMSMSTCTYCNFVPKRQTPRIARESIGTTVCYNNYGSNKSILIDLCMRDACLVAGFVQALLIPGRVCDLPINSGQGQRGRFSVQLTQFLSNRSRVFRDAGPYH